MKILTEKEQLKNKIQYLYELRSQLDSDRSFTYKKMHNAFRNKTILSWKMKHDNYTNVIIELQDYVNLLSNRLSEIEKVEKKEKELLLS